MLYLYHSAIFFIRLPLSISRSLVTLCSTYKTGLDTPFFFTMWMVSASIDQTGWKRLRLQPDMQIFSRRLHLTAEINDSRGKREDLGGSRRFVASSSRCRSKGDLICDFSPAPWEQAMTFFEIECFEEAATMSENVVIAVGKKFV